MAELRVANSETWTHSSTANGERYRVTLTTPMFPTKDPVPLLVVLDGDTMILTATEAARSISVSTMGALGPVAMVGIMADEPLGLEYIGARFRDFTPVEWTLHGPFGNDNAMVSKGMGGAASFVATIVDEIIPQVRGRVSVDESHVGICGWSLSGLCAAWAWRERPDVFADLVAISPSLWWSDASMVREPLPARPAGHRAVITAGEHEEGDLSLVWPQLFANGPQREMAAMVRNAVAFGEMTRAAGADTLCAVLPGEHHITLAPASLTRALVHLYGK